MCNQTVCLIAAEMERRGIATVCIMLLRKVAEAVRPPRALVVPYAHGYPLGEPGNHAMQRHVIVEALRLLERDGTPPLIDTLR